MQGDGFMKRLLGRARSTKAHALGDPFDKASVGYAVLDAGGRILQVNAHLAGMLGCSPSQMIGRRSADFYPDTPLGRQKADRLRPGWQAGGELHGEEFEMLRADGSIRLVSTTLTPIFDHRGLVVGARAVVDDLTAERQAEAALQEAESRFRVTFDNSPISMQMSDRDGRYTAVNAAMCGMLGYTEEQLLSMRVWDVVHPDDREKVAAGRESVLTGRAPSARTVNRFIRSDGSVGWIHATLSVTGPGGAILTQLVDITDLVETQQKLAASEERFRDLFDEAPIGYISIGEAGEIIQVNRRCAEILGSTPDEMLGRPIVDFYPHTLSGRADARERRERWLATGELRGEEFQIRRADGGLRWVRATASSIVGPGGRPVAGRSVWEDITEQKATEDALRRAEARFRVAFESAPIGMHLSTADGHYLKVNPALCRMLGYSEEQLLAINVAEVLHPDDRGSYLASRRSLFAGEVDQLAAVNRFLRSDGSVGWCRVGATLPDVDEGYLITQVADITDLIEAQERLSALMGEKDRFIDTVSHELRTPLAGALGFAAELRDRAAGFSASEVAEFAGLIVEGCDTAGNLVEDLLMAARIGREGVTVSPQLTDLQREAMVVVAEPGVAAFLGKKKIAVEGEPAVAWADPHRTRQILRNLVANALRHGGPEIAIRCGVRPGSREAYARVCDNGPGVPADFGDTLFQPYQHSRREGQTESIGLGLYLSRNLARLMGGDVVYFREGGETVFEVSLPIPEEPPA
jgi:PAS domain S-box-containing protein